MKKGTLLVISLVVIGICVSCAPMPTNVRTQNVQTFKRTANHPDIVSLNTILNNAKRRGNLTVEDLEFGLSKMLYSKNNRYDVDSGYLNEIAKFYADAIEWELLPHEPIFDRSMEKGDYGKAEEVRIEWLNYLNRFSSLRPEGYLSDNIRRGVEKAASKIRNQIENLQTPGITDPVVVQLRKELAKALNNKKWDEAQKIQKVIAGRLDELKTINQPKPVAQAPTVEKAPVKTETTIIVQPPAEQHVTVEQVPRYGATDVGRVLSLLDGKGGRLDSKTEGALKLLDIFLKR